MRTTLPNGRRADLAAGPRADRARLTVDDAAGASAVFRDRCWGVPAVLPYIQALERDSGQDFSVLSRAVRCSLVYQSGRDHLATRRAMAAFLSPSAMESWRPIMDAHVAKALDRLATATGPDLVRDLARPLFAGCVRDVLGLRLADDDEFFRHVSHARRFTEPLLSLRELASVQDAYRHLIDAVEGTELASLDGRPAPLAVVLRGSELPSGVDAATLVVSIAVAAHTASESLSFALWGLLKDGAAEWPEVAREGWVEARLEDVIRDWPSTLRLYRVAQQATSLGGRSVNPGDVVAVDVPAVNASLCPRSAEQGVRSFSFGDGVHKCPGAAFARLMLSRALPAIATRFPELRLIESGVRIERTEMVQAPTALPCNLAPVARRASPRQWDVVDPVVARAIATDDARFGPPAMEAHLIALQEASGHDLSTLIRIARNAPFFLSGPRHARIRLLAFEALGTNRLAGWSSFVDEAVEEALDRLGASDAPDLVSDFCDPLFRTVCGSVIGIHPRDPEVFHAMAPRLQAVLEPLRSMRAILQARTVFDTLLAQFDEADAGVHQDRPHSLLLHLAVSEPDDLDALDRKAIALVMYGASFNVSHTLANAVLGLARQPAETRGDLADPRWTAAHLDGHIVPQAASPRFIYRIAREDGEIGGIRFAAGDTMQLQLAAINRDLGAGHLAFGHGLHRCTGAALSRLVIRKALPALFARFPGICVADADPEYADNSQTVILTALPCRL